MAASDLIQESPDFKVEIVHEPDRLTLKLVGRVDERVVFKGTWDAILKQSDHLRALTFDLENVAEMNSAGIKNWLLFLQKVETVFTYEFSVIGEVFAELGGMIQNIFGSSRAKIDAFVAPYFCPACRNRTGKKMTAKELPVEDGAFRAPVLPCEKCGKPMEFDSIEDEFFYFLKDSRR